MENIDEELSDTYRSTNKELLKLIIDSHEKTHRVIINLSFVCFFLCAAIIVLAFLSYFNNKKWIDTFNSYDYTITGTTYSQDGNGQNNINNGTIGDLNNGSDTQDR